MKMKCDVYRCIGVYQLYRCDTVIHSQLTNNEVVKVYQLYRYISNICRYIAYIVIQLIQSKVLIIK